MSADNTTEQGENPDENKNNAFLERLMRENVLHPINNLTDAINKQVNAQNEKENAGESIGQKQVNAQERGNYIDNRAMYVSAGLGVLTIIAIGISIRALNIASRSADAADSAVAEYRRGNNTAENNYRLAKDAFESSNEDSRRRFKMDSFSARGQIDVMKGTLKETKREFTSINEPYLEITKPAVDFNDSFKRITIKYDLENLKPFPAQIVDKKLLVVINENQHLPPDSCFMHLKEAVLENPNTAGRNIYLSKEAPLPYTSGIYAHNILDELNFFEVRIGRASIYLINEIKYKGLISKTYFRYRCIMRLQVSDKVPPGMMYIEYYYNENIPYNWKE